MEFERFTVDDSQYPQRPANIPDDYYWDWEVHAWFPPGGPVIPDPEAVRAYEEAEWEEKRRQWQESQRLKSKDPIPAARRPVKDRHLITVDELRAAGALDVPPSWRKSLSAGVERNQLPLFGDDDTELTDEDPTPSKSDDEDAEEEVS